MDVNNVKRGFKSIADAMEQYYELFINLDTEESELGYSMKQGFSAVADAVNKNSGTDVGRLLAHAAMVLNESTHSKLSKIISNGILACGKALRGKTEVNISEAAYAFDAGVEAIMKYSGAKPGEKTILDVLIPARQALESAAGNGLSGQEALKRVSEAATEGYEKSKDMKAVHGISAYYADVSIGKLSGSAAVGKIIFDSLYEVFI